MLPSTVYQEGQVMISCTEFIAVYNELFNFLEEKKGAGAVNNFWISLSDNFLHELRNAAETRGLVGCFEYWSRTLSEEAADIKMSLNEAENCFTIQMRNCPSRGRLNNSNHVKTYPDYCKHCDVLYRRVLEPLGFKYEIDLSESDKAKCKITIKKENCL
jgi:hypothetical protein